MASPQIELLPVTSFMGGLNKRANALQLWASEAPDMLNIDLDPRGGIAMRKAVVNINATALASAAQSIWTFNTTAGTHQILVNRSNGNIHMSTGGNFGSNVASAGHTTGGDHRAVTFDEVCYIQNGVNKALKWTGSGTATDLTDPASGGGAYAPDFASPGSGNMPIAKCIAVHQGSVFVANTNENGTAFPNRVRFSHPNHPQAWRAQDFIDVDTGTDGDVITAMIQFGERLLVFKNNSLHVISGYSPATFNVTSISDKCGAPSQEAVCASPTNVYFFSWPNGAYSYSSRGLEWIFERLYPDIQSGEVLGSFLANFSCAWLNSRLWISTTNTSGSTNNHVYVFDPSLWYHASIGSRSSRWRQGGWTQFDLQLGSMIEWTPPGSTTEWLATCPTNGSVLKLEQDADQDQYLANTLTDIITSYTTLWFDLEEPARLKRWKRPEWIFERDHTAILTVEVMKDYDPTIITRTLKITPTTTVVPGSNLWGANWGTMIWGGAVTDDTPAITIQKTSAVGRARAIQFRVKGPTGPSVRWTINGITLKYIPLRIRP